MEYTSKEVYEYVSKHSNDPIVQRKKCRISWQDFPIYKSDLEFYDKISPTFDVSEKYAKEFLKKNDDIKDNFKYKDWKLKAIIPTPTLCPEERCRRRFLFRNEKNLYRRKCDFSGKEIISIYSPDKPYKVYERDYRWSDNRDPMKNSSTPNGNFYKEFSSLLLKTPVINSFVIDNNNDLNSAYTNHLLNPKNSYLCFNSLNIENCMYMREWEGSKDCINCDYVIHCENCHDCVQCFDSYNMKNCLYCSWCSFCDSCENCTNCHNCFNCYDLENKSYCINNEQYSKEEYNKVVNHAKKIKKPRSIIWCAQKSCDWCYGSNLTNCSNCAFISESYDCKNAKYCNRQLELENCIDLQGSCEQFTIEWISTAHSYHWWFMTYWSWNKESRYYVYCYDCSNIFGCVWLKRKQYCIYNKQYSKEEYNKIVPEIIAQMIRDKQRWEFFDPQLSYYGYNETIAMEYFPLTKEEAIKRWYKRSDYESPAPKVEKTVLWRNLPKQWCKIIKEKKPEILEKILNYAVICEVSKKPFRITKQEIDFYIKHDIPLPTKHPDVRHQERIDRKDPIVMHLIHCDECWEEMLSVHLPWKWKKILCDKCYYNNK